MNKRIVYTRPDGGVSVITPAPHGRLRFPRADGAQLLEPEEAWLRRIAAKDVPPDATNVTIVEEGQIPQDRTFRNSWTRHQGGQISVEMRTAREEHRERLRKARAPEMAKLDVAYQRADELGDAEGKREVARKKQELRDITEHPDIEAAETPHELAAVWPFGSPAVRPLPISQPAPLWKLPQVPLQEVLSAAEEEVPPLAPPAPPPEPDLGPDVIATIKLTPQPEPPTQVVTAVDDAARRRISKARIRTAVSDFARANAGLQMRYENAVMAHNGDVSFMAQFEQEAVAAGISIKALCEKIVRQRDIAARKLTRFYALQTDTLLAIDKASGEEIAVIEQRALKEINGDDA